MEHLQNIMDAIFSGGEIADGKIISKDKTTMAILKDSSYQPILDSVSDVQPGEDMSDLDKRYDAVAIAEFARDKLLNVILALDSFPTDKITIELTSKNGWVVKLSTRHIDFYLCPLAEKKTEDGGKEDASTRQDSTETGQRTACESVEPGRADI